MDMLITGPMSIGWTVGIARMVSASVGDASRHEQQTAGRGRPGGMDSMDSMLGASAVVQKGADTQLCDFSMDGIIVQGSCARA